MSLATALLALSAVQAVGQIGQGYVQKAESEYNATLLEGKAGLIDVQKGIEGKQYDRYKRQILGKTMAKVAASGINLSGSSMAVAIDTQKNIEMDKAIGQWNLEQKKQYTLEEARAERRRGKFALFGGYTNAFSTMLQAGMSYGMYKGMPKDMGGGGVSRYGNVYGANTPKGTFDMGTYSSLKAGRL